MIRSGPFDLFALNIPQRTTLLLVDDDPKNLLALEAVLDGLGQNLVRAGSGAEALRQVMKEDFSVIIMDVQMPGMTGFEAARLIRSRERSRLTPIIFLTAKGKAETDVSSGYDAGAVDYILKPFAPEILRHKVTVLIELYLKRAEMNSLNASLEGRVEERTLSLQASGRELARSNQELAQFASIASHDLQEPLRKILAFADRLQTHSGAVLDEKGTDYLQRIISSAQRMRQLVDDLLMYSRFAAVSGTLKPVDLGRLCRQVLGDLGDQIGRTAARIEVAELPTLMVDPSQMRQLFQNMISNALKFVAPGTPPEIRVAGRDLGLDEAGRSVWELSFQDQGIGFDEKYLGRIFGMLERLHTREQYEGTGMGLAICLRIAEHHGGGIAAKSRLGHGALFTVTLKTPPLPLGDLP